MLFSSPRGRHHYDKALQIRRLIFDNFKTIFSESNENSVDMILTPTSLGHASTRSTIEEQGPIESTFQITYTVPVNLAGTNIIKYDYHNYIARFCDHINF